MKVLIVDDEAPARLELRRLLSLHPEVTLAEEAANLSDALAQTARHRPDLVFLDIHLRHENGFDYLARLPQPPPAPRIVFVTAHDRYAIRAFECNALDYLLKPVHPERLAESLRRLPPPPPSRPATGEDPVFVKAGSTARFIPWNEIHAIRASGNYTRLLLADGTRLIVLRPLREWLHLAPEGHFLQSHRSALVQRRAILEIRTLGEKKRRLLLPHGREIPVGREYAAALRQALGG